MIALFNIIQDFLYEYKCVRFIYGYNFRTLTVLDLIKLSWVNVESRPKQFRLNNVHKIYNIKCQSYMKKIVIPISNKHNV